MPIGSRAVSIGVDGLRKLAAITAHSAPRLLILPVVHVPVLE